MLEFLRYLDIINLSNSGKIGVINSGTIASILGLFITLYILFYGIRAIKQFYVFIGRVPDIIGDLDKIASKILDILNNFEDSRSQIKRRLDDAEVSLNTLKTKISGRKPKKSIKTLLKTIKNYNPKSDGEDKLREIHSGLYKIVRVIKELQKDQKWEK